MITQSRRFYCKDSDATALLAQRIAPLLHPGFCLLLDGPVGAGKTHFSRALIQTLLTVAEDVPSPTFTLVQTYDGTLGPIWHADLYRLTDPFEVEELGLADAMQDAICLIEWPSKLGTLTPPDAAHFLFEPIDNARTITASWTHTKWTALFDQLKD